MDVIMTIWFFIMGIIFGSFYNVIGLRIPKGQSIIFPASHCPNCNKKLGFFELIPIISYIFQKGKCKHCAQQISIIYPIFETVCGLLFALAYLSFGFSGELIIALTFISMLVIIVVSDSKYLIIPDSILLIFSVLLSIEISIFHGVDYLLIAIVNGVAAFLLMLGIKTLGDFIFKKESMGGGDIKLMFVIGLVLSFPMSIFSIFLASFIGFPISLFYLKKSKEHIIPFGPLLATASILILILQIDINMIFNFYN